MTTAYTSLLGLALPVTGELSGTWGDTVNDYITQYLDASVAGTQTISGSQTAVTLSKTTNASLSQAGSGATGSSQYNVINCTGNPASMLTVTVPAASKTYVVVNATSTNQDVKIVGAGPTTGVTLVAGERAIIAWNGSDFIKVATSTADGVTTLSFGSTGLTPSTATSGAVTVAGTLVAANGGTGQSSYTTGDLLYATGSTILSKLGIGTNGQILTSTGTAPQWSTLSGVAVTTFSAGTTGFTPSSATSGAVTLAGTLATTNGGTGLTSFTANGVVYASSSSALTTGSALTWNGSTLLVGGNTRFGSGAVIPGFATASDASLANNASLRGTNAAGSTAFELIKLNTSDQVVINNDGADAVLTTAATSQRWIIGSEQMRLTSTGLGIGTSSPAVKLQSNVSRTSGQNVTALVLSDTVTGAQTSGFGTQIQGWSNNGSAQSAIGFEAYGGTNNDTALGFYTQASAGGLTRRMTISSTGDVGIGTSSPGRKLHVAATGTSYIARFESTDSLAVVNFKGSATGDFTVGAGANGENLVFLTSTTERARIDSSGNVGIGTSSPAAKLDVVGAIRTSVASGNSAININNSSLTGKSWDLLPNTASGESDLLWYYGGASAGTRMTLNSSGNLGLGVTPSAWAGTGVKAFQFQNGSLAASNSFGTMLSWNSIYDGAYKYVTSSTAGMYQFGGAHAWYVAPSGTAGNTISFTQAMTLDASGNLGVGTTSPIAKLTALGAGTINAPETSTTGASIQTASYGITTRTGNLDLGATDALAANIGGSLTFSARYSGTNAAWVTGKVGAYRETATSGVASSYLAFATTTSAGDLTERARITSTGTFQLTNNYQEGVLTANTGTAYTIDLVNGTLQILTLTGNCTFTFPTATAGQSFTMLLRQDATGGRTVTWPAAVRWPGNTAPTITSTASQTDKYIFTADGTRWYGSNAGQAYVA